MRLTPEEWAVFQMGAVFEPEVQRVIEVIAPLSRPVLTAIVAGVLVREGPPGGGVERAYRLLSMVDALEAGERFTPGAGAEPQTKPD